MALTWVSRIVTITICDNCRRGVRPDAKKCPHCTSTFPAKKKRKSKAKR